MSTEVVMQRFAGGLGCACLLAATWTYSTPARAELLVSETLTNSVVDVEAGGDFAGTPRFATGLSQPDGLCFGPNAEIYVVELLTGEVTIITDGGDFSAAEPFATGLEAPSQIVCTADEILVLERDAREVTDITDGGDFTGAPAMATGLPFAVDMIRDSAGTLWVATFPLFGSSIYDISAGGDFSAAAPYAFGDSAVFSLTETADGRLLSSSGIIGATVMDWTDGGAVGGAPFASGVSFTHILGTPDALWGTRSDALYDFEGGGNVVGIEPFATGLGNNSAFETHDVLFIPIECGNALLQEGESCDAGAETAECDLDCTDVTCGDATLNIAAGEDCDDGEETADCDTDCTLAECGDAWVNEAAEEACDDGEETDACDDDCTAVVCGDGNINEAAGEDCDDGNADDGDGCSSACAEEVDAESSSGGGESTSSGSESTTGNSTNGSASDAGAESSTSAGPGPLPSTTAAPTTTGAAETDTDGASNPLSELDLSDGCGCSSNPGRDRLPLTLLSCLCIGALIRRR